ncbi:MAG: EVE domain-containing protein [Acidobacteria bacterium]|nr:EVE domain-containing protein [Acidobacteriota bacterium]
MNYWLLLADPKSYSFDDLEKDQRTVWNGIVGSVAQKHMRTMKKGDTTLVYHTAPDKRVIGAAKVVFGPYPDPEDKEGKLVVVDIEPIQRLRNPVPLTALKENRKLAGMTFLRIQRIAVSPLTKGEFGEIVKMGQ